jgi:hypothetical protein
MRRLALLIVIAPDTGGVDGCNPTFEKLQPHNKLYPIVKIPLHLVVSDYPHLLRKPKREMEYRYDQLTQGLKLINDRFPDIVHPVDFKARFGEVVWCGQ